MNLDEYTLTELQEMLGHLEDMELSDTDLHKVLSREYKLRRALKFLFLEVYEDVE